MANWRSSSDGMMKVDDMRLNKSGTVGTEPIGKVNKQRGIDRYTELKFGKLGAIDVPNPSTIGKKVSSAVRAVTDKLTSTSRVNNATDPSSALSMAKRKAASRGAPTAAQAKSFRPQ